jgi:hypothetical protein
MTAHSFRCLALVAALAAAAGCSTTSTAYKPTQPVSSELRLAYSDGVEVWSGNKQIATGHRYDGLEAAVACVPEAKSHAEAAHRAGVSANVLSGLSIGLAAAGLGGLGGFAFEDRNTTIAFLSTGVALEVLAIVTGAQSLSQKARAHGNAIDAVNYYNDAVGYTGGCSGKPVAVQQALMPAAPAVAPAPIDPGAPVAPAEPAAQAGEAPAPADSVEQ